MPLIVRILNARQRTGVNRPVSLEVPPGFHDICVVANGPFARAKEIEWPFGKTRKRPA